MTYGKVQNQKEGLRLINQRCKNEGRGARERVNRDAKLSDDIPNREKNPY